MSMEEDLHQLKFMKKDHPRNILLRIAKITLRYRGTLPDSKERLGSLYCAGVLATKEKYCCRAVEHNTFKKLIEYLYMNEM